MHKHPFFGVLILCARDRSILSLITHNRSSQLAAWHWCLFLNASAITVICRKLAL